MGRSNTERHFPLGKKLGVRSVELSSRAGLGIGRFPQCHHRAAVSFGTALTVECLLIWLWSFSRAWHCPRASVQHSHAQNLSLHGCRVLAQHGTAHRAPPCPSAELWHGTALPMSFGTAQPSAGSLLSWLWSFGTAQHCLQTPAQHSAAHRAPPRPSPELWHGTAHKLQYSTAHKLWHSTDCP